jgi:hypothetical protein
MSQLDYIFSTESIREGAKKIFQETISGNTHFHYHQEKISSTVDFVMETIRENYPDMKIPFHSRWGHFRAGNVDRSLWLKARLRGLDPLEMARIKWDLVIPSVLLDAGAGVDWNYYEKETSKNYSRSEGLGIASFHLFLSGAFSQDGKSLKSHTLGLKKITPELVEESFQVSPKNPLIGVEGRTSLLKNLGTALENQKYFHEGRPGNLIDYLIKKYPTSIPATGILRAVLDSLGPIWPGREKLEGVNLGDVWNHSKYGLISFHKLSQWMTYSLIEPLLENDIKVTGVEELTGLPEYRNGGLLLDFDVLTFKNSKDTQLTWDTESDLIIEWRALTVHILDVMAREIQNRLGKSAQDFPLAKVLEGGTWWAGRKVASLRRPGGVPPLKIKTDGTVF